ncbi:MAG: hypothetical protein HY064_11045 [Bacteroidetes bacterium]|nr:hypothetical protein [Bacteroidota bacterium]
MTDKIIFEEFQQPSRVIPKIFILVLAFSIAFAAVNFFVIKNPFLYIPELPLVIISIVFLIISTQLSLRFTITSEGIAYTTNARSAEHIIHNTEIEEIMIGNLNGPFRTFKYGGFSVRVNRNYKMYLYGGYDALHIKMRSGQMIIFSTQRIFELTEAAKMIKNVKVVIG